MNKTFEFLKHQAANENVGLNFLFAFLPPPEDKPGADVGALLQNIPQRRPRPQHLRSGALGAAGERLRCPPVLPTPLPAGVGAAGRPAVPLQPTADRAEQREEPQHQPGGRHQLPLPEPLPQPASPRAGRGAHAAASSAEHLPAEGVWLRGAPQFQGVAPKRRPGTENFEGQSLQEEDGDGKGVLPRMSVERDLEAETCFQLLVDILGFLLL